MTHVVCRAHRLAVNGAGPPCTQVNETRNETTPRLVRARRGTLRQPAARRQSGSGVERPGDLLAAEPGQAPRRRAWPAVECLQIRARGLANHAEPDGAGAFPSVTTLVRYTGLSERSVRTCLDRLEAEGIIAQCDPNIVAARVKRAYRRPRGWNLNLSLVRDNLGEPSEAEPDSQHVSGKRSTPKSFGAFATITGTGCSHCTPLQTAPTGCSSCTSQPGRGAISAQPECNLHSHGVQRVHPNRA